MASFVRYSSSKLFRGCHCFLGQNFFRSTEGIENFEEFLRIPNWFGFSCVFLLSCAIRNIRQSCLLQEFRREKPDGLSSIWCDNNMSRQNFIISKRYFEKSATVRRLESERPEMLNSVLYSALYIFPLLLVPDRK